MNRAVAELYAPDIITLATEPDTPRIPFKHEVFEEAVKWLHEQGGYSADMLADPHAHRLIEETYNALNGAIGASITQEMPEEMTYALRNNAFIFSGFKTHRTLSEVGLELTDDEGNLKPYAKVLEDVRRIDDKYNGAYLYAEYNHAVHTTQMAVKWQDFVRDGDEYNLQYRTAGDERVREAHLALDGVTLPPSDKFWDRYMPPNGWNCRCTVVQVLREDFPLSDSEEAIKRGDESTQSIKQQMFRFNAGKTLELFPPKHPYLPKGCGDCQLRLNLAWGKGKEQCAACRRTTRYLLKFSRDNALNQLEEEQRPPVKIRGEQVQYRRLYYGKNDRENVIQHCTNPQEVLIALRLEDYLPTMQSRGEEDLKDKPNTQKKIDKGVKCYTKYEFEAEILERGQLVKRAFILKCEVIKTKKSAKCEYPYCIQPKE